MSIYRLDVCAFALAGINGMRTEIKRGATVSTGDSFAIVLCHFCRDLETLSKFLLSCLEGESSLRVHIAISLLLPRSCSAISRLNRAGLCDFVLPFTSTTNIARCL